MASIIAADFPLESPPRFASGSPEVRAFSDRPSDAVEENGQVSESPTAQPPMQDPCGLIPAFLFAFPAPASEPFPAAIAPR